MPPSDSPEQLEIPPERPNNDALSIYALCSDSDADALHACLPSSEYHITLCRSQSEWETTLARGLPDIGIISPGLIHGEEKTFFNAIRSTHDTEHLPIVLIGEPRSQQRMAYCIDCGADDFLLFPLFASLTRSKLQAYRRIRDMQKTLRTQNQQISHNHQYLVREQEVAKAVFDKVAHAGCLDMENIRHWLSPIAVFNGDVLLAATTPAGGLLVLLGDFTGHGLAAAIGAMPLASTFYSMAEKGFMVSDIVKELNAKLHAILPVGVFCCACIVHMDFSQGVMDIWNAGLPDAYLLRADDGQVEQIASSALALGILGPNQFRANITQMQLQAGDCLYMMSDGVIEATNATGEEYGEQRFIDTLTTSSTQNGQRFEQIKRSFTEFICDERRADDVSLVEIRALDPQRFAAIDASQHSQSSHDPVSWMFTYEVRPDSLRHQDSLPIMLHVLTEVPSLRRYMGQLYTILAELYSNALDHGILRLSSDLKHKSNGFAEYYAVRQQRLDQLTEGFIRFTLSYQGDHKSGELHVDVEDSGEGFDFSNHIAPSAERQQLHGRGIPLLQSICSEVTFLGEGNHVQAIFNWQQPS